MVADSSAASGSGGASAGPGAGSTVSEGAGIPGGGAGGAVCEVVLSFGPPQVAIIIATANNEIHIRQVAFIFRILCKCKPDVSMCLRVYRRRGGRVNCVLLGGLACGGNDRQECGARRPFTYRVYVARTEHALGWVRSG